MCQQCVYDGFLTQETFEKLEAFLERWPDAEWGPAHVVLSDANVDDEGINLCLAAIDSEQVYDHDAEEVTATRQLLEALLLVPEEER